MQDAGGPATVVRAEQDRPAIELVLVELHELRGRVEALEALLADAPRVSSTFVTELPGAAYMLRSPVPVVIEEFDDSALVSWMEMDISGSGDSLAGAMYAFRDELVYLRGHLDNCDDAALGAGMRETKAVLQSIMVPHA